MLLDVSLGNGLFEYGPQNIDNKRNNRQVGLYQIKTCLYYKGNNRTKIQPIEWGKIIVIHVSDKGLV